MIYNANALSTDPITGNVLSVYWSLMHNGRQRTGIVNVASLPPFPNEAAAILAVQNALGAPFITALEDEVANPPPPIVLTPNPPPDSPLTVPLPVPPVIPPPPETLPPGPPLPPPGF